MSNNSFNFDRCLKLVFSGGNLGFTKQNGKEVPNKFVVEYNPRKASYLCPRLEAEVIDTPTSALKQRPGYEATIRIFNPSSDILAVIGSGISNVATSATVQDYYKKKLRVTIYAGYFTQPASNLTAQEQMPDDRKTDTITVSDHVDAEDRATYSDSCLFSGYVNSSFLDHKSTDNILTLRCHDVDMSANQFNQIRLNYMDSNYKPVFKQEAERLKPNKNTFDLCFRWLVTMLADYCYPTDAQIPSGSSNPANMIPVPASDRGKTHTGWFEVLYMVDPAAYRQGLQEGKGLNEMLIYQDLQVAATDASLPNKINVDGFYTLATRESDALNDLCTADGRRLGYYKDTGHFGKTVYVVYPRGSKKNTVPLDTKGIVKVINFQNLLETPTVAATGSLNVKMWFNRDCQARKYLALVLDSTYTGNQEETGLLNINKLNFGKLADNQLIVPLGGTSDNAAVATTQLNTSMAISALASFQKTAAKNGYMFNQPFLMVKVVHKLTTHGKDWTTTVQTVPMLTGSKE